MRRSSNPVAPYTSLNIPVDLHSDLDRVSDILTGIGGGPYPTKSALMRDVVVAFCGLFRVGGRAVNATAGMEAMARLRSAMALVEAEAAEDAAAGEGDVGVGRERVDAPAVVAMDVVGGGIEARVEADMAEAVLNAKAPSQRDIDRVRKGDPTVSQAVMLSVWPYLTPSERVAVGSR